MCTDHTHILKHLTKSRPKGPSNRRLPTAHSRVTAATKREEQEKRKEDRKEKVEGKRERREREGTGSMLSRFSAQTSQTSRNEAPDHIHKSTPTAHAIIQVAPMEHEKALQGWTDRDTEEVVSSETPHVLPTTDTLTTHTLSVPLSNEELTYRIRDLKQEIRDFEASFVEKHNYKPTHNDKEPIREQLEELTRLRLQRKQTKQLMEAGREKRSKEDKNKLTSTRTVSASHHSELMSIDAISAKEEVKERNSYQAESQQTQKSQREHATHSRPSLTASTATAPRSRQDVSNSIASPFLLQTSPYASPILRSTSPLLHQSSAINSTNSPTSTADTTTVTTTHTIATTTSTVGTTNVIIDSATATTGSTAGSTISTIADHSSSNLDHTLKRIMASLKEKRRKAGRPEELKNMAHSQVLEEKQMVQRVLLHFEKIHGRPTSSADKDTMRPLYDHYRQIKKLLARGVASGEETMASITLLQSGLAHSLPTGFKQPSSREPELFHSALGVRSSKLTTAPQQREREMEKMEREKEKEGKEENVKEKDSEREMERKTDRDRRGRERRELASVTQVVRREIPMLKEATLIELYHLQDSTLAEKKKIRKALKDFESRFLLEHNRAVSKADKEPYQKEYSQYKAVKESLSLIANEINKRKLYQKSL